MNKSERDQIRDIFAGWSVSADQLSNILSGSTYGTYEVARLRGISTAFEVAAEKIANFPLTEPDSVKGDKS